MRNIIIAAFAAFAALFVVIGGTGSASAGCKPADNGCKAQVQAKVASLVSKFAVGPKQQFTKENCRKMKGLSYVWAPACREVKAICKPYFKAHGQLSEYCVEKCALCDVREGEILRWKRKCEVYGI